MSAHSARSHLLALAVALLLLHDVLLDGRACILKRVVACPWQRCTHSSWSACVQRQRPRLLLSFGRHRQPQVELPRPETCPAYLVACWVQ